MRIDKALENIRAVMESQEIEWLSSNGFEAVPHKPEPRRPAAPKKALSGHFAANRFLGTAGTEPQEPEDMQEPEIQEELNEADNEPEFVEVIKQKDNKHSWLYNEVVKAIRDASGNSRNTKVIAVFVPVVQNGKEFEELPVSGTVELSPVDEEAVKIETLPESPEDLPGPEPAEHVDEILPEPIHEPDPELAQAFMNMEAKLDENISAEPEEVPEEEESLDDEPEPEAEPEPEPEAESESKSEQEADITKIILPDELDDDEVAEVLEEKDY